MIVHGDNKMERLYYNGKHILKIYKGDSLIYNWYLIPTDTEIWINNSTMLVDSLMSNTDWKLIEIQ